MIFTEEEQWDGCIEQWEKIVADLPEDFDERTEGEKQSIVCKLKRKHKKPENPNCIFCYVASDCDDCPAKFVNPNFSCGNENYSYNLQPREFLAEIKRLNKIRCQRKQ